MTPRRLVPGMLTLVALMLLATPHGLATTSTLTRLARELTGLRAEVEALSESISDVRAETETRVRSLAGQKAELEAQVQREELRLKQLAQEKEKHLQEVASSQAAKARIEPTIRASLARVRRGVASSLPFKHAERLAALDAIETGLRDGMLRPEKAAARLWQLVEDELRLTRESGLYQQVLTVDGDETLAEVARLGMVAMYFKTQDGRVGRVARKGDVWVTETLSDEVSRAQILGLFDQFKKNIRVGFFELPNPTPGARP